MENKLIEVIANNLSIEQKRVKNVLKLLDEGATVPFISRYRKEMTDSLDEVGILNIKEEYERLKELEKRKETVIKSIEESGNMNPELLKQIKNCYNSTELEDIYLPYKPKKKTKASEARRMGLEPLAKIIMKQNELDVYKRATSFLNNEVKTVEAAIEGAKYIIAEWISENKKARKAVRNLFEKNGSCLFKKSK